MKQSILLLITLSPIILFGQSYNCDVKKDSASFVKMPHYGNNEILYNVLDITSQTSQLKSASIGYQTNDFLFNIPVKIWIYHNDNGTNQAVTEAEAEDFITKTNTHFANNNANIRFYNKCAFEHINSTTYNTVNSDDEFNRMIGENRDPKALNWHFISNVDYPNPDDNWGGRARFPEDENNFSFVIEDGSDLWMERSIVHEIGHTLGLLHTHESARTSKFNNGDVDKKCYQESVSRGRKNWREHGCLSTHGKLKCEINGDGICDTEASPRGLIPNLSGCTYTGTEKDLWGDVFTPPVNNFMSYTSASCRDEFTSGQVGSMHLNLILYMTEGEPWYNKNILSLSGVSNYGDNETYASSERIEVVSDNSYTINSGANVTLIAQNEITLNPGFSAKAGSDFTAKVEPINDCDLVTMSNSSQLKSTYISKTKENNIESKVIELYLESEKKKLHDKEIVEHNHTDIKNFSISPNPASSDMINLSFYSVSNEIAHIEVISLLGETKIRQKQVDCFEGQNTIPFSIASLSNGIYLIKLYLEKDGKIYLSKLVKE